MCEWRVVPRFIYLLFWWYANSSASAITKRTTFRRWVQIFADCDYFPPQVTLNDFYTICLRECPVTGKVHQFHESRRCIRCEVQLCQVCSSDWSNSSVYVRAYGKRHDDWTWIWALQAEVLTKGGPMLTDGRSVSVAFWSAVSSVQLSYSTTSKKRLKKTA